MSGGLGTWLHAIGFGLFGRHLQSGRHDADRRRFRALRIAGDFERYLLLVYAISWGAFVVTAVGSVWVIGSLGVPGVEIGPVGEGRLGLGTVRLGPRLIRFGIGVLAGSGAMALTRLAASASLEYLVRRRRIQIERTLPGAVRYLHVIASGTTDPEGLFRSVVEKRRIHGAAAESFESILRLAAITGSMETAIRRVARDTPSKDTLAPFLLTFLDQTRAGPDAVRAFLRSESRLLARADERQHRRETRYLRTVIELFVILLVLPVVLLVGVAGATLVVPDLSPGVSLGSIPELSGALSIGGSAVILVLGASAALFAYLLRPSGHRWAAPAPARRPSQILRGSVANPSNTLLVMTPVAVGVLGVLLVRGVGIERALVYAYVLLALPVGLVDVRRSRRRAEIDRRLPDFVHAVAERLDNGLPFRRAVRRVAERRSFGPLDPHVTALAFDLEMRAHGGRVRTRALDRFVGRIGTALAGRTIGLAVGALEAGADTRSAFATLQTETGRLVHADQARRSRFPVVIAIGWTVGLLIVAVIVTLNLMVVESAGPLPTGPVQGVVIDATKASVGTPRTDGPHFYVLSQATMLASGWFAGVAGRGPFEGLLHSGALVAVTYLVFEVSGLL